MTTIIQSILNWLYNKYVRPYASVALVAVFFAVILLIGWIFNIEPLYSIGLIGIFFCKMMLQILGIII